MSLPTEHPEYIFRIGVRPEFNYDLADVDISSAELLIGRETKNIERLQFFSNLNKLWIQSVNQNQFDTILSLVNPKMLYIYDMRVEDLSLLSSLTNVEVLALEWNTKATKLWDLSTNTSLRALSVKDLSKLNDISTLQNNKILELLDLSGGDWDSLRLNSLEPLRNLPHLKYLGLSNIKVQDESLEPVSKLISLQELEISNQFPTIEYARLSVSLPHTKCEMFKPYVLFSNSIDGKDVMVVGKRKPMLNSKSDQLKLQKYKEQFKALQNTFKP